MPERHGKGRLLAALFFCVLPAIALAQDDTRRAEAARLMQDLMSGKGEVGGDFSLTDSRGKRRSLSDFRGKWVLLYFGFTTCPDVCPTDLFEIGKAVRSLGKEADRVQPVFVTLDPERDRPAVIGEYVASFHPRFVAFTGTPSEIATVAGRFKVFHEKVAIPGGLGYTIDHAAFTYLLRPDGKYQGIIPPGTPADRIQLVVRDALEAESGQRR